MSDSPLQRLIEAARRARKKEEEYLEAAAPYGFSARVAAIWGRSTPDRFLLLERLAWRGLICAVLVCAATGVAQKSIASLNPPPPTEPIDDATELFLE